MHVPVTILSSHESLIWVQAPKTQPARARAAQNFRTCNSGSVKCRLHPTTWWYCTVLYCTVLLSVLYGETQLRGREGCRTCWYVLLGPNGLVNGEFLGVAADRMLDWWIWDGIFLISILSVLIFGFGGRFVLWCAVALWHGGAVYCCALASERGQ